MYLLGVTTTATAGLGLSAGSSWTYVWFAVGRIITGFGIGGEYSAINSAIDELIPARVRGTVDLAVNGSYWLGAGVAAIAGYLYLSHLPSDLGWRIAFATGAVVAIGVLLLRLYVPESPRRLMIHGQEDEAERVVSGIEEHVENDTGEPLPEADDKELELRARESTGFVEIAKTVFVVYPKRTLVGFSLMASQAFLYNALFFTYGLMLTTFYDVKSASVGLYLLPFAAGNFLGPIILGPLFDRIGRRRMIGGTFILGGALAVVTGWLFQADALSVWWQTLLWVAIFFFASAGASAGYLTVSETFPLEVRAMVIAFFYAIGTGVSGVIGPWLFGTLISSGARIEVFWGYAAAGGIMVAAGIIHATMGVRAEQTALEDVAAPLSAEDAEDGDAQEDAGQDQGRDQAPDEDRDQERDEGPRHRRDRSGAGSGDVHAHVTGGAFPVVHGEEGDAEALEDETRILVTALAHVGPARRRELSHRVRSKYWGPGQFRRAVRHGVATHRISEERGLLKLTAPERQRVPADR